MGLLSGGQRQAVSLVMATLRPTKIQLLDEHTAALELGGRTVMLHEGRAVLDVADEERAGLGLPTWSPSSPRCAARNSTATACC